MTTFSEQIFSDYQVRKTKKQKLAFIRLMQTHFPELRVEESKILHNRNLVAGDWETAEVILSAHYDTCAVLPFPNFIMPKNLLITVLYSLLICIPFFLIAFGVNVLLSLVTDDFLIHYWTSLLLIIGLFILVFFLGLPNKHTANDNTSGVITLCELMERMPEEMRKKVLFVFFDNEENGLLGSAFFRKLHKKEINDKLILNFDCVSDGDHILLVVNKAARKKYGGRLEAAFQSTAEKTVHLEKSSSAMYPSDQAGFPMSAAVAALKKLPLLGLYLDRIHTGRDRVFDGRNIEYLCKSTIDFLSSAEGGK